MAHILLLADDRAEVICGGWRSSTFINAFKASKVETGVGQSNQSNNFGLGLLAGYGNAQSMQGNASGIFTLVG